MGAAVMRWNSRLAACVFVALLWASPVMAAITRGAGGNGVWASGTTMDASAFVATGGNSIIVGCREANSTANTITASDTAGNTYTPLTKRTFSGSTMQVFYSLSITGNASNVVRCTLSGSTGVTYGLVIAEQYSGLVSYDIEVGASAASGTGMSSGAFTTSTNNELIIGFVLIPFTDSTNTPGANFTIQTSLGSGTLFDLDYTYTNTAGSHTITSTGNHNVGFFICAAAFTSGAGTPLPHNLALLGVGGSY